MAVALSDEDVEHVARLARLALTPAEKKLYREQLSRILEYAKQVNNIDTENVPPTYHSLPLENVMRKDAVEQTVDSEKILQAASKVERAMYLVPRILEE